MIQPKVFARSDEAKLSRTKVGSHSYDSLYHRASVLLTVTGVSRKRRGNTNDVYHVLLSPVITGVSRSLICKWEPG